jgi:hypothetical protein
MLLFLKSSFVRNSQLLSAFLSARSNYPATVRRSHSFTETVLILSFFLRRLECALHVLSIYPKRGAKMLRIYGIYKINRIDFLGFTGIIRPISPPKRALPAVFPFGGQIETQCGKMPARQFSRLRHSYGYG